MQALASAQRGARRGSLIDFEQILADTAVALTAKLDVEQTCSAILDATERVFGARTGWILLFDRRAKELVACAIRGRAVGAYGDVRIPVEDGVVGLAFRRREVLWIPNAQTETRWFDPERIRAAGLQSVLTVSLAYQQEGIGVLGLDSPRFTAATPPTDIDIRRLRAIAALAAVGLRNARLYRALEEERTRLDRALRDRRELRGTIAQLRTEIQDRGVHRAIVGNSAALQEVLGQVDVVAPADSTVLIIGETGTGKELIARAIHERSRRSDAPFIAVNCAALPESLIESELFGHEKGAFTGAIARKAGKFELANRGTLFLDEIGDMPLAAQAKLLRVLQEREVQRIGGTTAISVNVRMIAATNQELQACMEDGRFRRDLFYRLTVFPIHLPPLRSRVEDIPLLAEHFVKRFAAKQHATPPRISEDALAALASYSWPGNVRELQNVIERAVILARGGNIGRKLLMLPPTDPHETPTLRAARTSVGEASTFAPQSLNGLVTFSEAERHAILNALHLSGWRISGPDGAAAMLGLKPTTLHAKMKKLGIRRPSPSRHMAADRSW